MALLSLLPPARNPVVFTPSGVDSTVPVTVTWDTGTLASGRLTLRVDGGAESVCGFGRTGSAVSTVTLNQTQTFTLRSALGQVLATLVLTTALESAAVPVTPSERIRMSRVTVHRDSIHLRWRTALPISCWAEATAPGERARFAWTDPGSVHEVRFDRPGADCTLRIATEGAAARYVGTVRAGTGEWVADPAEYRALHLRTRTDATSSGVPVASHVDVDTPAGPVTVRQWPDGSLAVQGDRESTPLGGPFRDGVLACVGADGLVVVATTAAGDLVACGARPGAPAEWVPLGQHDPRSVAAVPTPDGVHVLVVGADGTLRHRVFDGAPDGTWESLEPGVAAVSAVGHPLHGVAVVAVTGTGAVRHRRRDLAGGWDEWVCLGSVPEAVCVAYLEDPDTLALTAVDPDDAVQVLAWTGYPASSGRRTWMPAGTLTSVEAVTTPRSDTERRNCGAR
ncbi:hypothetical protein [Rhodococcus gannanensis]|uniref:Uncharacterized protein n=1 Tax=Rhodococcus gannanensis TaxID=1960308 RepID=A0ABW4PAG5_9NOCA